jgi:hypothetical protein
LKENCIVKAIIVRYYHFTLRYDVSGSDEVNDAINAAKTRRTVTAPMNLKSITQTKSFLVSVKSKMFVCFNASLGVSYD